MARREPGAWQPRPLRGFSDLRAEIDAIERAEAAGTLRTTGGWTAGQILEHCGRFVRCSIDGFEGGMPWVLRVVGRRVIRPLALRPGAQMKPGIRLPRSASALLPGEGVSVAEGAAVLRGQLDRVERGERMEAQSPLLGALTHEQWERLHLSHCTMHLGFVRVG